MRQHGEGRTLVRGEVVCEEWGFQRDEVGWVRPVRDEVVYRERALQGEVMQAEVKWFTGSVLCRVK